MRGYICSGCRNHFMQPPRCMSCGAQQLYDNTVRSQGKEIERQAEQIEKLQAALLLARIAVSHACEDSGRLLYTQDLARIDAALGEKQ